jgi:hypothetical protein
MSMEMSFFTSCPLTGGLSVPLHTMCTSTSLLSSRNFVRVSFDFAQDHELVEWHWCKAASRLVFVRAWLKKDISTLTRLTKDNYVTFNKSQEEFSKS